MMRTQVETTHNIERAVGQVGLARDILAVLGFVVLLALSAQIKLVLPGTMVPVTMQTLVVLLCGFALRPALAISATVGYILAGFTASAVTPALPFFAAIQAGFASHTLGYLLGFVAAAGAVSAMRGAIGKLTFGRALAIGTLGMAAVFVFGVAWLALTCGSLEDAVRYGLTPFVLWAAVKVALAAALVQAVGFVRS